MAKIEVDHLRKAYGSVQAVNDLSFEVEAGAFFALLGENGAGKTTTISCLIGNLPYDSGHVKINGIEVQEQPKQLAETVGVVFQESLLDDRMTVQENLETKAALYQGVTAKRIDTLVKQLDLEGFRNQRYGHLSGGQRRRVDVARALLHNPQVLFLDEPTAGLDPQSRHQMWQLIEQMRRDMGMTVILTTHYMEETEYSDQVLIIKGGQILDQGTPAALKRKHTQTSLWLEPQEGQTQACLDWLAQKGHSVEPFQSETFRGRSTLLVKLQEPTDSLDLLNQMQPLLAGFEVRQGTMDEVFLTLLKKGTVK